MKCLLAAVMLCSLLSGCAQAPPPTSGEVSELTVFAAASLTDAFAEIEAAYEAGNPGVEVLSNFASSRMLRTQIESGAPADIFASANTQEMDGLVAAGLVERSATRIFATNHLVIILPASDPAGLRQPADLARPGLKLVMAAEEVPVGNYSRQALSRMDGAFGSDFTSRVLANVVSNEDNVRQVVAKVQLGEADAGIVYASDAMAAPDLKTIEIPAEMNVVARYPIAVLSESGRPAVARDFVAYVLSPAGQVVLKKWGFGPVE